ncbi:tetratricopeptide repeat protein, partial [Nonomuraea angiospora]|uniref:tetratricopeptide repeat protein n=1 Tax=Nonomuraea angiospora TaxID=46172 RepID=UPI003439531F
MLAAHRRDDRSAPDTFNVPDFDGIAGVLVVVDYAERWDTADLLTLLSDTHLPGRLPVRMLLLARSAGNWWQGLSYRLQHDLHLIPTRCELKPLEQETALSRAELYQAARDRFADLLDLPDAGRVPVPQALQHHEAYELVLSVHMAALAGVLAYKHGSAPPGDPVEVSTYLLQRERALWTEMYKAQHEAPLSISPDAMGQVVYTATVTGRLHYDDALTAVERAGIESRDHPGQLLRDHALCYPSVGSAERQDQISTGQHAATMLEPLYPDRLGEDFLALSTPGHSCDFPADPWAMRAPARLLTSPRHVGDRPGEGGDAPVWVRHGLITLIEAARRWPHLAKYQVYPLLADHPHLALQAGGAALATLADLDDIAPALLETIESVMPDHRHIDLDIGIAAVATRLAQHRLAATTDPATRAHIYDSLAVRLSYAGLRSRALDESRHAARLWHHLVQVNPSAYLPNLAMSLNNHAALLAEVGRQTEAVPVSQEALRLHRELAKLNRDAYLPNLAGSLHIHAALLAEVGRRAEAVPVSQEALHLHSELAKLNRDSYLPKLAMSLNTHAALLVEIGRQTEAVPVSQEALRLHRELAKLNRDAYLPSLASSLNNHAIRLAEVGRQTEAVPVSREAVHLHSELAKLNRDSYLPKLAGSLNTHAIRLAEVGRQTEAVPVSQEALRLHSELAKLNRDAYLPSLASSLNNHAIRLAEVGRQTEAVPVSEEAVRLRRELTELNRDAYL